jgi:hypothetical protein
LGVADVFFREDRIDRRALGFGELCGWWRATVDGDCVEWVWRTDGERISLSCEEGECGCMEGGWITMDDDVEKDCLIERS